VEKRQYSVGDNNFSNRSSGRLFGYTVHSTLDSLVVPDFTVKHSYNFTCNGTTVVKTSEQKIDAF
jgi:hypothetical protein